MQEHLRKVYLLANTALMWNMVGERERFVWTLCYLYPRAQDGSTEREWEGDKQRVCEWVCLCVFESGTGKEEVRGYVYVHITVYSSCNV